MGGLDISSPEESAAGRCLVRPWVLGVFRAFVSVSVCMVSVVHVPNEGGWSWQGHVGTGRSAG